MRCALPRGATLQRAAPRGAARCIVENRRAASRAGVCRAFSVGDTRR